MKGWDSWKREYINGIFKDFQREMKRVERKESYRKESRKPWLKIKEIREKKGR